jgi:type I restriction enzyme, S subunit
MNAELKPNEVIATHDRGEASADLASVFDLVATAPDGAIRLRELILDLAVRGKLLAQNRDDQPALELMRDIESQRSARTSMRGAKTRRIQDIDCEEPYELPEGWQWVRIPDVAFDWGQTVPQSRFTYIDVGAIDNVKGVVTDSLQVLDAEDAPSRARRIVKQGTVLYSTVRPYLKNIAIIECEYDDDPIASTAFAVLHPYRGVSARYLYYYLRSQSFTNFVSERMVGVAYPAINDSTFREGPVPLPPEAEQLRIVERTDELMVLCDSLEYNNRMEIEQHARLTSTLLESLVASDSVSALGQGWQQIAEHFDLILDRADAIGALESTIDGLAIRGMLVPQDPSDESLSALLERLVALTADGSRIPTPRRPIDVDTLPFDVPLGWKWVQAQDLCRPSSLITYGILKPVWVDVGVPTVRVQDMRNGEIVVDAIGQCSHQRAAKFAKTTLETGDLLVAKDGATLGKTAFVPPSLAGANITQHVLRFPITPHVDSEFVRLVVDSPHGQAWMRTETKGVALPGVNVGDFRRMPIPLPPLAEQHSIVARVKELRHLCAKLRQRLTAAQWAQRQLANALVIGCA